MLMGPPNLDRPIEEEEEEEEEQEEEEECVDGD